eukprot:CAMPEP_0174872490 /NCGR_PEP_ID=MMETSP1114-20130205/73345_1 /TAXON_ID=312471 /ORGANISM="Neobodo designis, Strain CCAP 1951/1" /LENGTH=164 /DNA_ID=CAMNT_0016107791 /DNA_START=153 /DNA_END=644 /DNA_ORIENTATION=-
MFFVLGQAVVVGNVGFVCQNDFIFEVQQVVVFEGVLRGPAVVPPADAREAAPDWATLQIDHNLHADVLSFLLSVVVVIAGVQENGNAVKTHRRPVKKRVGFFVLVGSRQRMIGTHFRDFDDPPIPRRPVSFNVESACHKLRELVEGRAHVSEGARGDHTHKLNA